MNITIKKIRIHEIAALHFLINNECSIDGTVLRKSYWQLLMLLDNYQVAVCNGKIIGCAGFKCWPGRWCEIVSVVLKSETRGKGIGIQLVQSLIVDIQSRGYHAIFCLTGAREFFAKLGFCETQKNLFPMKIWSDCKKCPKNIGSPLDPQCPEIAMILILNS